MVQLHPQGPRPIAPAAGRSPPRWLVVPRRLRTAAPVLAVGALAACDGPQSALAPAGRDAETIAGLAGWMIGGAAVVWLLVIGIAVWALVVRPAHRQRDEALLVLGGGVALPTVVLTVLLVYGLVLMPGVNPPAPPDALRIEVEGRQWWWRVHYRPHDARAGGTADARPVVPAANEVRLPVGEPVELALSSPDVVHSFWIPPLGGKMDMIPGRVNRLVLEPTRTGVFRGVCAEYCGASHALMAFPAVVVEEAEFAAWLDRQAAPAAPPEGPLAARGAALFAGNGCGACHAIRGTAADGAVGPDLTHVGGRLSVAAGTLSNDAASLRRWIAGTERIKPGVHMPAFGMLPERDLDALAAYLEGLK